MRFFDLETYEEGFPSHSKVINARKEDFGDKKKRTQQYPCDTFPTEFSCVDKNSYYSQKWEHHLLYQTLQRILSYLHDAIAPNRQMGTCYQT